MLGLSTCLHKVDCASILYRQCSLISIGREQIDRGATRNQRESPTHRTDSPLLCPEHIVALEAYTTVTAASSGYGCSVRGRGYLQLDVDSFVLKRRVAFGLHGL